MAPVPRDTDERGPGRHRARRRCRDTAGVSGAGREEARARGRARSERADVAHRPGREPSDGTRSPGDPGPRSGRGAPVPGRRVRSRDRHLPPPVRGRSGGDGARTGARAPTGRLDRDARVPPAGARPVACRMVGLHASRDAGGRRRGVSGVGSKVAWFQRAGIQHVRTRLFLFGTAVVLWGVKGR